MEQIRTYNLPISNDDFRYLLDFLSKTDPFISYQVFYEKLYDYFYYIDIKETRNVIAILDRNIVSRVSKLAVGDKIPEHEQDAYKIASATMAFLLLTDTLVEPGISLHEYHKVNSHDLTENELINFRVADNLHPQSYTDIVLGRLNHIKKCEIREARNKIDSSEKLGHLFSSNTNDWKVKYLFSLVAVSIKKNNSLNCGDQFLMAVDWMFNDALFDFVAFSFFLHLFSNKKSVRIVKNINSKDNKKILTSIKNTAWDLSYLQYLKGQSLENDEQVYLFVTNDSVLKSIGNSLNDIYDSNSIVIVEKINELYTRDYSHKIISKLQNLEKYLLSGKRKVKAKPFYENIDKSINRFESKLLDCY